MKKYFLMVFIFISLFGIINDTHADTSLDPYWSGELHLTKENSPYVAGDEGLNVMYGESLVIDPGVTVKFPDESNLTVNSGGTLRIGSEDSTDKVVLEGDSASWYGISGTNAQIDINSLEIRDSFQPLYLGNGTTTVNDLLLDGNNNVFDGYEQYGIDAGGGTIKISSSSISNFKTAGIHLGPISGSIDQSDLTDNKIGIVYDKPFSPPALVFNFGNALSSAARYFSPQAFADDSSFAFSGSKDRFAGNLLQIDNMNQNATLDFRNNYWGSNDGPAQGSIVGSVLTSPFLTDEVPKPSCCSNVVFIPGIESNRLFTLEKGTFGTTTNQLWEPNIDADVQKLFLDANGKSINPNVQVGTIIDKTNSFGPIFSRNIYKSFIDSMNGLVPGR